MSGTYTEQKTYREELFKKPVPEGQRRCSVCLHVKPDADFNSNAPRVTNGKSKKCLGCREYHKRFAKTRRERQTEQQRVSHRARSKELRDGRKALVIAHYGGKCACCGVSDLEFLTMDHKEKIGSKKRRENGEWGNRFYLTIIKRGFPDHLRCLCWNCNWAYGCYGECPHQKVNNDNQERLTTPTGNT